MSDAPDNTQPVDDQQQLGTLPQLPSILGGSGLEKIVAGYLQHLTANQPPPVSAVVEKAKAAAAAKQPVQDRPVPAPGSFGSKMADAAKGVMGDLGDAAHATDVKGGGWLSGVASTLNARNQRLAQQQKDSVLLAHTQAETVALHRNLYQQEATDRATGYKNLEKISDQYEAGGNHDIEKGVSNNELMNRMKSNPDFAHKYRALATSEEPVRDADGKPKKDSFGNPVMSPLYSVITIATKDGSKDDKVVSAQQSSDFDKYLGIKYPEGTKLTEGQMYANSIRAEKARNATVLVNNSNGGKELSDDQMRSLRPYLTDETIQHAISSKPGSAYAGIQEGIQNADDYITQHQQEADAAKKGNNQQALDAANAQIKAKQEERQKLVNFSEMAITPKQKEDYNKDLKKGEDMMSKAVENPAVMEGKTPAYEAILTKITNDPNETQARRKQASDLLEVVGDIRDGEIQLAKDKKNEAGTGFQGDPAAISPEAFLKSLTPSEASLVKQLGTGRIVMDRMSYLATRKPEVLEAVGRAYPNFDASKAASYPATYKDFTSGKTGVALNSGGAVMGHLKELFDLNTPMSHLAHSPSWTAYQNKADTVATELAKFYGDSTVPAIAAIKETLTSTLPGNREAAITTQAQSMGDKLEAFEQQWKNAAPSEFYQAPLPFISTKAKMAFASLNPDYAAAHPELGVGSKSAAQQSPAQFQGKIGVPVPGDKTHYFNTQAEADNFKKLARIQ